MDWKRCVDEGWAKTAAPNRAFCKSLLTLSDRRARFVQEGLITAENAFIYIGIAYDALRELCTALCNLRKQKITNHQCLGALLGQEAWFSREEFDLYRQVRNDINYYGEMIAYEQGMLLISKMLSFRLLLRERLVREL